jgi:hypothetical protein
VPGLAQILDHVERALARVVEQYKEDDGLNAIHRAFARQIQEVEDALWGVNVGYILGLATGYALEVLGRYVDETRDGSTDDEFTARIRAKIRALKSTGSVEDLYSVLVALFANATPGVFRHEHEGPQGQTLTILGETVSAAMAVIATRLIGRARGATERTILVWRQGASEDTLECPLSTALNGGAPGASTTLTVYSTAGFPVSGTLLLNPGFMDEEQVTYTGKTSTTFTGVSATGNAHDDRTVVYLVDPTTGAGFDETLTFGDASHAAGATTLTVLDTSSFPASGSLILETGTAVEEIVTYTGKTATSFTGVSATVYAHNIAGSSRWQVTLVDSDGGELAGAALAE